MGLSLLFSASTTWRFASGSSPCARPARVECRAEGIPVTLLFLLRNPQKLISKEELVRAVWGEVAVADGSLTGVSGSCAGHSKTTSTSRATSRPYPRSGIGSCARWKL